MYRLWRLILSMHDPNGTTYSRSRVTSKIRASGRREYGFGNRLSVKLAARSIGARIGRAP